MNKYQKYKDSGVQWLGEIPESWFQEPFSSVFSLKSIINNKNEELLSVYLDKGVIRFSDVGEKRTNVTSEDLSKYQLVEEGDFVLNNQQAWRGSVGVSFYRGIVSPAYIVLAVKNNFDFRFLNYLLRNRSFVTHYLLCSKGVGTIQRNLYWPQLKRVYLIFPSLEEQTAIANFLDDKTVKIDQAIAIKEKEIALLKERRQILIQKAVTKGLDSNVKLKDSGVDWIGEIPEHWEVTSVKNLLKIPITDGPHTTPILYDDGIPFISAEAIKDNKIDFSKMRGYISERNHIEYCKKYKPMINDIYMIKSGATTGNIAMVETDIEFSIWSPLAVFRANQRLIPKFLFFALQSIYFKRGVELKWSYGTQQNIGMGVLANLPLTFTNINEQTQIVSYLEEIEEKIAKAISLKQQEIEKLKEYKTVLIDNVVTGKVRVNKIN